MSVLITVLTSKQKSKTKANVKRQNHLTCSGNIGEAIPVLKSILVICMAYASQSFLLKLNTMTGANFLSRIILTILKQLLSCSEITN